MKELILVCEDIFGLEVLELINQINFRRIKNNCKPIYKVLGYISDNNKPFGDIDCSLERLGSISEWKPPLNVFFVLGMSNPKSKFETVKILKKFNAHFETIITPWSLVPLLEIGEGCVVSSYTVKSGLKIGNYVTIIGSMLSGKMIDDYSTILRFSNIAGDSVGKYSFIGNHVFLAVGKNVGDYCRVADGSIVVRSIKSGTSVFGVPAKRIKT